MSTSASPAGEWLDRFLEWYYGAHPVNASFIGVREHDHRLPPFGEEGADSLSAARGLLARAPDPAVAADDVEALDLRLATGFLRDHLHESESSHGPAGNPALWTGEAVFSVLSLFLRGGGAATRHEVEAAQARMEALPAFLQDARTCVRAAPPEWTARAARECRGALAFFGEGLELLTRELPGAAALERAAGPVREAFARHLRYLEGELAVSTTDAYACGAERMARILREVHALDVDAEDLAARGRDELARAEGELVEEAERFGVRTPAEALRRLEDLHPAEVNYYARYSEIWRAMRSLAERRDLVTWPDHPIEYVPRPAWARGCAPYLYFLNYRSPAVFAPPPVHTCFIPPLDDALPPPERARFLRAHNDAQIKVNHVVHHGGLGHHVQNAWAALSPSRIGRIAGIDAAARISLGCGGTMTEGWACYAVDLTAEAGGLSPLERYGELRARGRMCARAVVDVELHTGRMAFADAVDFYRAHAGMSAGAARTEAVKNSMFPGSALIYMVGRDLIVEARRGEERALRGAFDLRRFHDDLLELGSVPVSLAAARMRRRHEVRRRDVPA